MMYVYQNILCGTFFTSKSTQIYTYDLMLGFILVNIIDKIWLGYNSIMTISKRKKWLKPMRAKDCLSFYALYP